MLLFILGIVVGVIISAIIVVAVMFFRTPIERRLKEIVRVVDRVSPSAPKGFVFEPPTEQDEAREAIIQKNSERGAATKIRDLL